MKRKTVVPLVPGSQHVTYVEIGDIRTIHLRQDAMREIRKEVLLVREETARLKIGECAVAHEEGGCYLLITNWPNKK
jgi:hypothetical protein